MPKKSAVEPSGEDSPLGGVYRWLDLQVNQSRIEKLLGEIKERGSPEQKKEVLKGAIKTNRFVCYVVR